MLELQQNFNFSFIEKIIFEYKPDKNNRKKTIESFIEKATNGDPSNAAFFMAYHCGSARKWAEGIIERAKVGNPSHAAYYMARFCKSSRDWAERIIERDFFGEPAHAAILMHTHCESDKKWVESIIFNTENPQYWMKLLSL